MKSKFNALSAALLGTGMLFASSSFSAAHAGTFTTSGTNTWTGGNNNPLSASAVFEAVGNQLKVTLTNTAGSDVQVPTDVLTGLFFQSTLSNFTLSAVSATMAAGSLAVENGSSSSGSNANVSNEWAFKSGTSRGYGLSVAGLGIFGKNDVIGTNNNGVGGLDYGLLSAGDNITTGNGGVNKSGQVLYKGAVSFLFNVSGGSASDVASSVTNVGFQYGTATNEPYLSSTTTTQVPEPAEIGGIALAALVLGGLKLKMNKKVEIEQ